ncbi:MAG: PepSY-associated TM helix domain-containing protein [Pirellulaceae bacterium]
MAKKFNLLTRRIHRWGGFVFALPMFLVVLSGVLLQVKKQVTWVQPPTMKGAAANQEPAIDWGEVLNVAKSVPEANVTDWEDIDRLDVRPGKGIIKVQCMNRWELQIDLSNATLLSSTYRRSDFIEGLHDGSIFGEWSKLGLFLSNGIMLLFLLVSGLYLWYLPIQSNARKRLRQRERKTVQKNEGT